MNPQERLLGGLGHALRVWPGLEPALREAAPMGVDLSLDDAFGFLREAAPALEQAGFAVLAPAWWQKRLRPKLHVSAEQEPKEASGLLDIEGLCAYEWRLAVGDATLTLAELRELAALKLPLVKSRIRRSSTRCSRRPSRRRDRASRDRARGADEAQAGVQPPRRRYRE